MSSFTRSTVDSKSRIDFLAARVPAAILAVVPAARGRRVADPRAVLAIGHAVRRLPQLGRARKHLDERRQLARIFAEAAVVIEEAAEEAHAVPVVRDWREHVEVPEQID